MLTRRQLVVQRGNVSSFEHFVWLFDRALRSNRRNLKAFGVRVVQTIVIGVFIGILFWQLDDDQVGINDRAGLLVVRYRDKWRSATHSVINTNAPACHHQQRFQRDILRSSSLYEEC